MVLRSSAGRVRRGEVVLRGGRLCLAFAGLLGLVR